MPDRMSNDDPILIARNVYKTYRLGRVAVPVLKGVSLEVGRGEFLGVLGASGSGKSTLLHLLGALDRPDRGTVEVGGRLLTGLSGADLAAFRNRTIGFVF